MERELKITDVVALLKDMPENKLTRGLGGTIVEILHGVYYEIEFCGSNGEIVLQVAFKQRRFITASL